MSIISTEPSTTDGTNELPKISRRELIFPAGMSSAKGAESAACYRRRPDPEDLEPPEEREELREEEEDDREEEDELREGLE